MSENSKVRIMIAINTIVAIIIGFISTMLEVWQAGIVGIILLAVLGVISTKRLVSRNVWIGNGLIIFLFVWFVSWVLFFNIFA